MRNDRSRLTGRNRWLRSAIFALGLASAAATAQAQTTTPPARAQGAGPPEPSGNGAAASNPHPVEGVTVEGRDRGPDTGATVPADKKAEFDEEAARDAAFREYRESRPPITSDDKGVGDPNDQSKDFPGLQSYVPR